MTVGRYLWRPLVISSPFPSPLHSTTTTQSTLYLLVSDKQPANSLPPPPIGAPMGAKRRARRSSSEDSVKPKPAKPAPPPPLPEGDGSEEEEKQDAEAAAEEIDKSGNAGPVRHSPVSAASKPKEMSKGAKKPSPPPPAEEGVGARGSGDTSPVRDAPTDELAVAAPPLRKKSRTKKTTKRIKRHLPPSEEERAHDGVRESGDPSLVSKVPAGETASLSPRREIVASPDHNKRAATPPSPKRAKRGSTPPQEEEQAEKRTAGAGGDGSGEPQAETGAPADKVKHKKKGKKHQKADPAELGFIENTEEAPDARNTTSSKEKDSFEEEEQQGDGMVEQDHAGNISPPQVNNGTHEKEQQGVEIAEQEHADNTSLPQQKDITQENEDTGVVVSGEALPQRNASSRKLCTSDREKKPAIERLWSREDELKILTALVEHAQSHGGALPDSSDLLANLTFDKTDANADKLDDKIRRLRVRYGRLRSKSQGLPTDDLDQRLFELSEVLWGQVDDDVKAEAAFVTGDREFSQRSSLYPYLAKEVKVYAERHNSGDVIMAAFTTISDDEARRLDAMCRKQRIDAFNLELSQANLTKAMLSAFSSQIN
ncbi:unnamed protein product [Urochloa humidicola]